MKLYIAVHEEVPDHMVPVLVAHAVLGADCFFHNDIEYRDWKANSFKKVVLRVNQKEFEKIYKLDNVFHGYEKTVKGGDYTCLVVCPRSEYPNVIKFAKMWRPNHAVAERPGSELQPHQAQLDSESRVQ